MYVCVFKNNVCVDLLKQKLDVYNKKMCVYVFACVCTCCLEASAGLLCLFSPIPTSSSITMSTRPNCAVVVIKSMRLASYCSTTTRHASRSHGLEVLLLLVKSQRGILYWVAPNTSPYGGVGSRKFLELLKKTPERGLLRSALIRCPLPVCSHHMRIAQLMTMAWFKSE